MLGVEMEDGKALKEWFDERAVEEIARRLGAVDSGFDEFGFVRESSRGLDSLELMERVKQVSGALRKYLPEAVPEALRTLVEALPEARWTTDDITDGYLLWPMGQLIADHAVDHFEPAMEAMVELTQRFSSEFAVRPFIERYPDASFARLRELTGHANPHVRRWCSEGCRPRLPWGKVLRSLVRDPSPIWPILDALKDDPEPYVRRSVANNLNDIAKDHAEAVISKCREWQYGEKPGRDWVIRHALRSLVKAGHPDALDILGLAEVCGLEAALVATPRQLVIGESVLLSSCIRSSHEGSQCLAIDFVVTFVRKNERFMEKVFKWKVIEIPPAGEIRLQKRFPFRQTSTRTLYPGVHKIALQVNGKRMTETELVLGVK